APARKSAYSVCGFPTRASARFADPAGDGNRTAITGPGCDTESPHPRMGSAQERLRQLVEKSCDRPARASHRNEKLAGRNPGQTLPCRDSRESVNRFNELGDFQG